MERNLKSRSLKSSVIFRGNLKKVFEDHGVPSDADDFCNARLELRGQIELAIDLTLCNTTMSIPNYMVP